MNYCLNPTVSEKVDMAKLQFAKSLEIKSEPVGIYEMRRHFSNYFKGLPHFKEIRLKLLTTLDVEEIYQSAGGDPGKIRRSPAGSSRRILG